MGRTDEPADPDEGLTLALLDTLLQTAPVGLGYVDADLNFVRVNETLSALDVAALADQIRPLLRQSLDTGEPVTDAAVGDLAVSCYPVRDTDGRPLGIGLVVRDATEQQARARHLEAVAHLGQRALVIDDFDGVLREGVELLAGILGLDYVYVAEHHRDNHEFLVRLAHGFEPGDDLGGRFPDDQSMAPGYALEHRTPVVIDDVAAQTQFVVTPLFAALDIVSVATVVIRGPGWPYGVLGMASRNRRTFRAEEVDFAQSIANVLGTAAARHRIDAALRSERERLRLALDAGGMGDWEWDLATNHLSWSDSLHDIFGVEQDRLIEHFDDYLDLVHPEDRQRLLDTIAAALEGAEGQFYVEHRAIMGDGSFRWFSGRGRVMRDADGNAAGMIGVGADITDRIEAEYKQAALFAGEQEARAEAERARDRLEFIAEASEVLSSSLDYRATLAQVAHLAVSRLADWCTVDVRGEDGERTDSVVVAHVDPAKVAAAEKLRRRYPPDPTSETGVEAVFRSGEPSLIAEVTDEMLVQAAVDDEHLALLRDLGLRSAMIVPLVTQGQTFGAITFIAAESGRVYDHDDLALATDLARRAAVAIDNARLYEERTRVAEALQRSLLPLSSPEIPGLEVAVRYRPVGRGTEIGGDFYDVFEAGEGSWVVVIGDVCGKGTEAAAVTGLARDTIRGLSIRERSPQRVLRVLNEVMLRRGDETRFLTVAMARLEVDGAAGVARLRIACAGHPLPVVVRADGSVEEAGNIALLLGLFPEIAPSDAPLELRAGDAVVLYTDGVVEAHGPEGLFGDDRLREVLADVGSVDAETVAQTILDAVGAFQPGPAQDDVAIVVLRVPHSPQSPHG